MNIAKMFQRWDIETNNAVNFNGIWRNELNSEMELRGTPPNKIEGVYRPSSQESYCKGEHQLKGFFNDNLISFVVDFEHHSMLASWTGHYVTDGNEGYLNTMWHLVKSELEHDLPLEAWGSVYTGTNRFVKVS